MIDRLRPADGMIDLFPAGCGVGDLEQPGRSLADGFDQGLGPGLVNSMYGHSGGYTLIHEGCYMIFFTSRRNNPDVFLM